MWNQESMKGKSVNLSYSQGNLSQAIFRSLPGLEIPAGLDDSESNEVDFDHVDNLCGLYAFLSFAVIFAHRAPQKRLCFWRTPTVFRAVKGEGIPSRWNAGTLIK